MNSTTAFEASPVLQRVQGVGEIVVRGDGGVTRLERLYQEGAAKLRLPKNHGADGVEAVLINSAGGLTGGDRMTWRAEAESGARLILTTQACEKVYRASSGVAKVETRLVVGDGARLDWLPQETILYDRAALARSFDVEMAADATFLAVEAVLLGRRARGEVVEQGRLNDRWRVRRGGRLVFADGVRLQGAVSDISAPAATLGGGAAYASLLLLAPNVEGLLAPVREAIQGVNGVEGGASAFDGKLFCRMVAQHGLTLRRALLPAMNLLRGGIDSPRVWTI